MLCLLLTGCSDDAGNSPSGSTASPASPASPADPTHKSDANQVPSTQDDPQLAEKLSDDQATAIVQKLMRALVEKDEKTIVSLMITDANAEVLWKGEKLKDPQRELMLKQAGMMMARRAQPGEDVKVADRTLYITDGISNDARPFFVISVSGKETGMPLWMKRVDGRWRVDMGPIIAARTAAIAKARELEKLSPKESEPSP